MRRYRFFALIAITLSFGYWIVNDLVVERVPVEYVLNTIDPSPAIPGAVATLRYSGRQNYRCEGLIRRWIVDSGGTIHDLPDVPQFDYDSDEPALVRFAREIDIPPSASSGAATIHVTAFRWCNIMQHYFSPTMDHHTLHFDIK